MSQQEACFIFDWRRSRWDYRLPLLIALSLFGHVFCFYIFHVVYPTTTTLLPPSAQVTVLDPNNPQDRNLLDWVEMNNPANVSAPRFNPRLVAQLTPRYKPIFSSLSVELKTSDSSGTREQAIPSIFSPEALLPMRSRPAQAAPTKMFSSRLEIASTLQARAPVSLPALPAAVTLSEPTSLFIGVDPDGEVDFVFLRQSSGIGQLDQKAEEFIRTVKFKPEPRRDWGVITLHWGGTGRDSR
ncbi:MAG: energy transducer TonB [Verrucomicrobia bacterium]|jgi:TonB family protein|nr:energy transducer TonB [Verrucomicrobiota bacterium]